MTQLTLPPYYNTLPKCRQQKTILIKNYAVRYSVKPCLALPCLAMSMLCHTLDLPFCLPAAYVTAFSFPAHPTVYMKYWSIMITNYRLLLGKIVPCVGNVTHLLTNQGVEGTITNTEVPSPPSLGINEYYLEWDRGIIRSLTLTTALTTRHNYVNQGEWGERIILRYKQTSRLAEGSEHSSSSETAIPFFPAPEGASPVKFCIIPSHRN